MTTPQLTPEEHARLDQVARRTTSVGVVFALVGFVLALAAIWIGDWRLAATSGLVGLAAIVIAVAGAALNSPEARKRTAERLHGEGGNQR